MRRRAASLGCYGREAHRDPSDPGVLVADQGAPQQSGDPQDHLLAVLQPGGHLADPLICDMSMPPIGEGRCDIFQVRSLWRGIADAGVLSRPAGEAQVGDMPTEDLGAILDRKKRVKRGQVYHM